jgi:two-component system sensor histidine kinase KdpD
MLRFDKVLRQLRGIGISLLMVAAMTVLAFGLTHFLEVRRGSVMYLIPVLLAGWHLGLVPALVAAIGGVMASGYFFYFPNYMDNMFRSFEIMSGLLFIAVAMVVSHLANNMKRQTQIARKRESEIGDLYAFSRQLAAAPSAADIYRAIEDHFANHIHRRVVLFGTSASGTAPVTPDEAQVPDRVRNAIADIQHGATAATTVADGTGNTWLIRPVSQKTPAFGVIAIDLGKMPESPTDDVRHQVDDMLSDAAATLERLDIAHALAEANMRSETELLREALIGSVSHELRTPLTTILGAATILRGAPAIEADERLRDLASVVRDEAERLNNDIQNLLDATRISSQQVKPHPEWIEPVDIVNSALERRTRQLNGHKVSLDMDSNLPFIYVDPVLVQQAFVQIIDNAAKYSPADTPISVAAKRNGQNVILSVNDQGVGVTEEEKAQLGDRFFRGPRHAATISGSGLGLWIAKAFVSANGGKVEVTSAGAGRGTTVSIHLPLRTDAPQPEALPDD